MKESLVLKRVYYNNPLPLKLRTQFLDCPHVIADQTFAGRVAGELHTIKTGGSCNSVHHRQIAKLDGGLFARRLKVAKSPSLLRGAMWFQGTLWLKMVVQTFKLLL